MSKHDDDNKFWSKLARKARTPHVPTPEEAEKLFQEAEAEAISDDEVAELTRAVVSGTVKKSDHEPELSWLKTEEQRYLRDGAHQMNRNLSEETDEEAEAALEELRRKHLDDDDDEPSEKQE